MKRENRLSSIRLNAMLATLKHHVSPELARVQSVNINAKRTVLIFSALFVLCFSANSQTAADVLEKSIRIKKNERLFLEINRKDTSIYFAVANNIGPNGNNEYPVFKPLNSNQLFATSNEYVEIYMRPYNPLNYSHVEKYSEYTDPIDSTNSAALATIISMLKDTIYGTGFFEYDPSADSTMKANFKKAIDEFNHKFYKAYVQVQDDKRKEIHSNFLALKALTFDSKKRTVDDILSLKIEVDKVKTHYDSTAASLDRLQKEFDGLMEKYAEKFITDVLLIKSLVSDLKSDFNTRKSRFLKLEEAQVAVVKMKNLAQNNPESSGIDWQIPVTQETLEDGKIATIEIEIKNGLSEIDKGNEIKHTESKSLHKQTILVRTFNWIVPEVSLGTAYIFMKYNEYSVGADSLGQHIVGSPVEKQLDKLAVTAMLNLTLYIPESRANPFWQLGAAYTSGMPSIFSGFGLRVNANRMNRLAISFGAALTWTKELDKLSIGDSIEGQSNLDEDLKLQLAWPPKPYVGIQYNF